MEELRYARGRDFLNSGSPSPTCTVVALLLCPSAPRFLTRTQRLIHGLQQLIRSPGVPEDAAGETLEVVLALAGELAADPPG